MEKSVQHLFREEEKLECESVFYSAFSLVIWQLKEALAIHPARGMRFALLLKYFVNERSMSFCSQKMFHKAFGFHFCHGAGLEDYVNQRP